MSEKEQDFEKRIAVKTGGTSPNAKPFNAASLKARIAERKKQGLS
jgi:hypothetical protein